MEKLWEVIKDKLESPFLSNYFIGLLLFNRNVVYTALTLDYNYRVHGFFIYNGEKFRTVIELLKKVAYDDELFCWPTNIYLWPVLYAIVITGVLPYVKNIFKAISDHADDLHKRIYNWLLKIPTVTQKEYDTLEETKNQNLVELEAIKNERKVLYAQISNMNTQYTESGKTQIDELNNKTREIDNLKHTILLLSEKNPENRNNDTVSNSFSSIFEGKWKLEWYFDVDRCDFIVIYFGIAITIIGFRIEA